MIALDDWFPSLPDGKVMVTFTESKNWLRVWGDDDFGMEMLGATRKQFEQICSKPITKALCRNMGMKNA